MNASKALLWSTLCAALFAVTSCGPGSPQVGSQTNWLRSCDTSAECGRLECVCGTCTATCSEDANCDGLGSASCVPAKNEGAIALCDGRKPSASLCLAICDEDTACPGGASCLAGVCAPAFEPSARVTIDPSAQHQTLIGFGASLGYSEDTLVAHPQKEALFDAMFAESGLDVIRFRNRLSSDAESALQTTSEILTAAAGRLGRTPTLFMTSGSPPAALKANGDTYCIDADPDCTLVRGTDGTFDYAAFAEYWRTSLEAYEAAGIHPDYVSIQNNADWIPPDELGAEACRFLPEEGVAQVTTPDGQTITAEFPGYVEALAAVESATGGQYAFAAPEVGSAVMVGGYSNVLAPATFDALTFHLYGTDPRDVDTDLLETVRGFGQESGKPVIQSEMNADGIDTAILTHYSITFANAAAYVQGSFAGPNADDGTLIDLGADGFETLPVFHALAHFARATDPGWIRVDAANDSDELLSSAWLSPDEASLTIVLVNPGGAAINAEVSAPEPFAELLASASVTRTVFDGVERSSDLGVLPEDRVVRLPGHAIVTVAVTSD